MSSHPVNTRLGAAANSGPTRLGRSPGKGNSYPLQYSGLREFYGQRSLKAYSPWHCKESDTTARFSHTTQNGRTYICYFSFPQLIIGTKLNYCFPCFFYNYFHIYLGIIENIIVIYYSVHHCDLITYTL